MTIAVELARLMLPYLALAGPVAVMMGVLNANGRFATAALRPRLSTPPCWPSLAWCSRCTRATANCPAASSRSAWRRRRLAAGAGRLAVWRGPRGSHRSRCRSAGHAAVSGAGHPGSGGERHSADHRDRRRHGGFGLAQRGVMDLLRQPADRIAARHCRHRGRHRAGAGVCARHSRRRQARSSARSNCAASSWRSVPIVSQKRVINNITEWLAVHMGGCGNSCKWNCTWIFSKDQNRVD